jgi:hypothetical protein
MAIRPTAEEKRNGWNQKALNEYLAGREKSHAGWIDPANERRAQRPDSQNHRYNPHRWRG